MSSEAKARATALRLQFKEEMRQAELLEQEERRAEELRVQEEERKRQEEGGGCRRRRGCWQNRTDGAES